MLYFASYGKKLGVQEITNLGLSVNHVCEYFKDKLHARYGMEIVGLPLFYPNVHIQLPIDTVQ